MEHKVLTPLPYIPGPVASVLVSNGTTSSIPESIDTLQGLNGPQVRHQGCQPLLLHRGTPVFPFPDPEHVLRVGKRPEPLVCVLQASPLGQRPGTHTPDPRRQPVGALRGLSSTEREAGGPGAVTVMAGATSEKQQARAHTCQGPWRGAF